jgi:glycosyltransferase involved in cell wall biosynthesis
MVPVYFNGKFYAGGLNGVHRVSDRLIREVDSLLAAMPASERPVVRLLLPRQRRFEPQLHAIEAIEQAAGHTQKWEQMVLPRVAADGLLVNLANLAPIRHRRKLLLLHDAQFLFPDSSYPWRQRLGYRLLTPRMARSSRVVLTVSDYSRQMLDLLGVAPRALTQLLYNGCDHIHEVAADTGAIDELGLAGTPYVLMFGSPKAYKNVGVVFAAFANKQLAPLRLVVVGGGKAAHEQAGLTSPDDTVWAGSIDDAKLRALYEGAHALAFPSRTEGFGLPPLEAMLCDCPSVVSPAGAIPEVCRDAALYADVDDPASWRTALRQLDDPEARDAKVRAGRDRARGFTWEVAGRRLLDVITAHAIV